jgi:hypothetical protein
MKRLGHTNKLTTLNWLDESDANGTEVEITDTTDTGELPITAHRVKQTVQVQTAVMDTEVSQEATDTTDTGELSFTAHRVEQTTVVDMKTGETVDCHGM